MYPRKFILLFLLIGVVFVSGCVSIDVEQKLKRNGSFDMDLTVSTVAEYKSVLGSVRESLQVDDSIKDRFQYSETDTSITYSFYDIDPKKDTKLFKKIGGDVDTLEQLSEGVDYSIFDPDNVDFEKELKFPYYEYTYTLDILPESREENNQTLSGDEYITDELGVLDQESEKQLMGIINNIYQEDSIEVIIVNEPNVSFSDYYRYKEEKLEGFDFKGNGGYVFIFMSTDGYFCRVETNVYTDSDFNSKISSLNGEFSGNCTDNYPSQVEHVVSEIYDYTSSNDIEYSFGNADQIGEFFKIGYAVEVFGEVVSTNGLRMEENKVKFDVNPISEGQYTIVFRELFLPSVLGDFYWVYLIVLIAVVGGFFVYRKYPGILKKNTGNLRVPVAVNPRILEYVRKARISGMGDDQIRINLANSGWQKRDIDIALNS